MSVTDRLEQIQRTYPLGSSERFRAAVNDLIRGFRSPHIWLQFGWHDVKQRYRRSVLGPFWLTASTAIMVGTMGFLYARILGQTVGEYLPYLAIGLIVWQLISQIANDGCQVYIQAEQLIRQINAPISVHVLRMLCRNAIIFAHQAVILIPIALFYGQFSFFSFLTVFAGMIAILLNGWWVATILGAICARFRDIPLVVQNIVQIMFFISPILWKPGVLGNRIWVAQWNPIYHLIEIVRAPILTKTVPWESWLFVLAFTVIGFALAIVVHARTRGRIAYWV